MVKRYGNITELGVIEAVSGTFSTTTSAPTVTGTTGAFGGSLSAQNGNFSNSLTISGMAVTVGNTGLQDVVDDTTPQLGGNLDVNGFSIVANGGNSVTITSANSTTLTSSNGSFSTSATTTNTMSGFGKVMVRSVTDEAVLSGTTSVFVGAGSSISVNAPSVNFPTSLMASGVPVALGDEIEQLRIFAIPFDITTVTGGPITFLSSAPFGGYITSVQGVTSRGTASITFFKNSSHIQGLTNLGFNTSSSTKFPTSGHTFVTGDRLRGTISGVTSENPVYDFEGTIIGRMNI